MLRVLPGLTVMPAFAVSFAPSQRMRLAVPVTVTRVLITTFGSVTTYVPFSHEVVVFSTTA